MIAADTFVVPVILCGGSGTRLWPLSRENTPKQFLKLGSSESLLNQTAVRALFCSGAPEARLVVVTLESLRERTRAELGNDTKAHILGEPMARNTAAAIAYAARYVQHCYGDRAVIWVLPADHHIGDVPALRQALADAVSIAREGKIVTFGIVPTHADTSYGYIEIGAAIDGRNNAFAIKSFAEKPDSATAQYYVGTKCFTWNSGMFVFDVKTILGAFDQHAPRLSTFPPVRHLPASAYNDIPSDPFDIAIMEKIANGAVVTCDIGWSDVGSWNSIWELRDKDPKGNALSGRIACIESTDCLIQSNSLLVAAIGLEDVAIIEDGDSLLVADKKNPQAMRALVDALRKTGAREARRAAYEERPWGSLRILTDNPGYVVKEVTIKAGQMQSLHSHSQRCEFITVISGNAHIHLHDTVHPRGPQEHIYIPLLAPHRIENTGNGDLILVEVQVGQQIDETDIVRFDDLYGRASPARKRKEPNAAAS